MTSSDSPRERTPTTSSTQNSAGRWLTVAVAATGIAVGIIYWSRDEVPAPAQNAISAANGPPETAAPYVNPAGYVGFEKCAACHAERVREFRSSRHCLACVAVTDKTVPPAFRSGDAEYTPHDSRVTFQMRKQGDQYVQIAVRETAAGEEKTVSPLSLMYGYGAGSDEVYFTWSQDRVSELPISWLHPIQGWGTSTFDRSGSGDYSRPTSPRCLECHNTWLEHIPGTRNTYRRESLIAGVTCEVCHGRAREHVQFHESHPGEDRPMHIVRPALLSRQLQMDLCAYCHSNSLKHRGPAFSYRPGLPLAEYYKTLTTRNPEDDHVANQTTYLKRSKCYRQSDSMTCVTCHNPHVARDLQQRGSGRSACMTCHETGHCTQRPQLPEPVRDNCVGCHMPRRDKIQVNFDTAHDVIYPPVPRWEHQIGVDRIARDEVLVAWHQSQDGDDHKAEAARLSDALARTMEQEGDELCGEYRYLAASDAYRRSLAFAPSSEVRRKFEETSKKVAGISRAFVRAEHDLAAGRIDAGIETLLAILDEKPDHAKARGRLGTLYATKGQDEKALALWKSVTEYDPDDAYGEGMIGWYWYLHNDPEKSIEALLRADEIEPYSFKINFNLAQAYLKLDQAARAVKRLTTANQIEPQNVQCGLLLNSLLRQRGDLTNASEIVERLSQRTHHRDVAVEMARADTQAESGRTQAALATLEALRNQLVRPDPQIAAEIANRLRKLRAVPHR